MGFTVNHRAARVPTLAVLLVAGAWCCESESTTLFPRDAGLGAEEADAADTARTEASGALSAGDAGTDQVVPGEQPPGGGGSSAGTPAGDTSGHETSGDGTAGSELADAGVGDGCTGCVRLSGSGDPADYQLQLGTTWNLTTSVITWRVRVRNSAGEVSVVPYVQSGDASVDEANVTVGLTAAQDWQELSLDLRVLDGGVGAANVNSGPEFNGRSVTRVGIAFDRTDAAGALIELDGVTFAGIPGLSTTFSSDQGGFRLVDSPNVSATLVPE